MVRSLKRSLIVLVSGLVLFGAVFAPALAAPGGNAEAVERCKNGGYLAFGGAFKNAGECVKHVSKGNALPDLAFPGSSAAGALSGTGFPANSTIDDITGVFTGGGLIFPRVDLLPASGWTTNAAGAFTLPTAFDYCTSGGTAVAITVVAGGVSYTETFPLSCPPSV